MDLGKREGSGKREITYRNCLLFFSSSYPSQRREIGEKEISKEYCEFSVYGSELQAATWLHCFWCKELTLLKSIFNLFGLQWREEGKDQRTGREGQGEIGYLFFFSPPSCKMERLERKRFEENTINCLYSMPMIPQHQAASPITLSSMYRRTNTLFSCNLFFSNLSAVQGERETQGRRRATGTDCNYIHVTEGSYTGDKWL